MRGITGSFDFEVVPTEVRHGPQSFDVLHLANGYPLDPEKRARHARHVEHQLERFPEGQFVAVTHQGGREVVVGTATTLRTRRPPEAPPLCWRDVIGDYSLPRHDPEGAWLYGVEIAVHPDFQRRGIASALYAARLALVPELGLEGWYAGGMLMGYHRFADVMSPREYAERVLAGELTDPTVTMQLNRGLQPLAIIEDLDAYPCSFAHEELRGLWANLLATEMVEGNVHIDVVRALKEFSVHEVRVLKLIYTVIVERDEAERD